MEPDKKQCPLSFNNPEGVPFRLCNEECAWYQADWTPPCALLHSIDGIRHVGENLIYHIQGMK